MAHLAQPSVAHQPSKAEPVPAVLGDGRPGRARAPSSRPAQALPWPEALLTQFGLRMASHGMSISRIGMQVDTGYALQQLAHAREMGDASLAALAEELFHCFQIHRSWLPH